MTAAGLRESVMGKFQEGQEVVLHTSDDRSKGSPIKAIILKFNPSSVLTEHNGYKESFTYFSFMEMQQQVKKKPVAVLERSPRGSYKKSKYK